MSDSGQRAVPYYCPFCASQDLWPAGETHGQWECRSCTRAFALRFVGLATAPTTVETPVPTTPPAPEGGDR